MPDIKRKTATERQKMISPTIRIREIQEPKCEFKCELELAKWSNLSSHFDSELAFD